MNGNMRQPSDEVPPPFTSTAKGSNSLIPAAMGINDDLQTKDLEETCTLGLTNAGKFRDFSDRG
ncbi:hypothetical protein JHK86_030553 [Glycine max]|nr:hypothetical protein JHK86_030553 [Glycine max]